MNSSEKDCFVATQSVAPRNDSLVIAGDNTLVIASEAKQSQDKIGILAQIIKHKNLALAGVFVFFVAGFFAISALQASQAQAAISYIGSAVGSSSPNTGITINLPGSMQTGDLIIVAGAVGDTTTNGLAAPSTGGYTRIGSATVYANGSSFDVNLDMYYKFHNGTDTQVAFGAVGGTNASNVAVVHVYRGVATVAESGPFDTTVNTTSGTGSATANPPSHNHSGAAGTWTVAVGAAGYSNGNTATYTGPANYTTNFVYRAHDDTTDALIGMGYNTGPADPEDPGTFTPANVGTVTGSGWAAATISLKPQPTITLSGTCDGYDQTTDCVDGVGTVKLAVNGVLNSASDATFSSGAWSMSILKPASGNTIIVFLDAAADADEATSITKYDGSGDIDNVRLYKQQVTVGTDGGANSGQSLASTDFDDYDGTSDTDVFYDVLAAATCNNVASFTGICIDDDSGTTAGHSTQEKLHILTGNTLAPASNVMTHDMVIVGTYTSAASQALTVSGSWTDTGTFTHSTSTVTFTSTGTGETITSSGSQFNNLTFNGSGGEWTLQDMTIIASVLTITAGNLNAGANGIYLLGSGTPFVNNATFTYGSSVIYYQSSSATNIAAVNMSNSSGGTNGYYNLEIIPGGATPHTLGTASSQTIGVANNLTIGNATNAGATGATHNPAVTVAGDVFIHDNATYTSGSGTLTVGDDFTENATGVYTASTNNTVVFNNVANDAIINGGTGDAIAFYNFSVTTANKAVKFIDGETVTINGLLTLTGTAGNTVTLDTSTGAGAWTINHQGTESVDYITVTRSTCHGSSTQITTTNSIGNSITGSCWVGLLISVTVGGTVYSDQGSTNIGADKTVTLKVNGAGTYTDETDSSGVYSIPSVLLASGHVISVYLEAETENATTVTVSNGSTVSDLHLYKDTLIVRYEVGSSITNTNLDQYDDGNDPGTGDVVFDVASSNLTVQDGSSLFIWENDTFAPGGTVTTSPSANTALADGDVLVAPGGTLSMAANALSIGGDFGMFGAMTFSGGQTTTFTATATGHGHNVAGGTFENVVFNGAGGGWAFSQAKVLNGDLTMTAGTLSGTQDLTVNGGDVTGDGDINISGGTFLVDGTGNFGGATNWDFNNLTFGDGSGTATTTSTGAGVIYIGASGVLTIAANQTLDAGAKVWALYATSGTPMVRNGTFTANTSNVYFGMSGSGTVNLPAAAMTGANSFTNLTVWTSATVNAQAAVTATRQVSLRGTLNMGTNDLIVGNTTSLPSNILIGGVGSTSISQNSANTTTILMPTGSTYCIGGAGISCTTGSPSGNWAFGNLVIGDGSTTSTLTIGVDTLNITMNNLTVSANATLAGTDDLTASGAVTGDGILNFTGGTFTHSSTTSKNFGGDTGWTFNNLTLQGASGTTAATGSGSVTLNGQLTVASGHTLNAGSKTWIYMSGTMPGFDSNLTPSTSTFSFRNTSGNDIYAGDYHNLEFAPASGTPLYSLGSTISVSGDFTIAGAGNATVDAYNNSGALDIAGDFTIGSGDIFLATDATPMTVGGSWSNSGTFTHNNGEVIFDSADTGETITSGASNGHFNGLSFENSAGGWTLQDNPTVVGVLTISNGNLNASSRTITLSGTGAPFIKGGGGTFTQGTSTVNYTGTANTDIYALNGASTTDAYYNLGLGTTADSDSVIYSLDGSTTVNGTVTVSHASSAGTDTLAIGTSTLTLKGSGTPLNITVNGDFSAEDDSTVQYTSGSGVSALSSKNMIAGEGGRYGNLVINGSGTFTAGVDIEIGENFTITSGTFSSANNVIARGNVAGNGVINHTANTFSFAYCDCTSSFGGDSNWSFANLTLNPNGIVVSAAGTGTISVSGELTIGGSGSVLQAGSKTWILSGTGTPFVKTGTLDVSGGTSTFSYRSTEGAITTAATYDNLDFSPASGNPNYEFAGGTTVVNNDFTIAGAGNATVDFNAGVPTLDINGSVSIGSGDAITAGGVSFSVGGSWTNAGTYTDDNTSTVIFDSTSTGRTITSGGSSFGNVIFNGSGGGWSPSDAMALAGDMTLTAGILSGTQNVTVNGGDVTGAGDINMSSGTFTITGTGSFGGATAWDFNNLTFSGDGHTTTASGAGAIDIATTLTISGTHVLSAGAKNWILSGATSPISRSGTFTADTSTVTYDSATGVNELATNDMTGSNPFYNLVINSVGDTFTAGRAINVGNELVVSGGTLAMGGNALVVGHTSNANSGSIKVASGQQLTQSAAANTYIFTLNSNSNCIGATGSNCSGTAGTITVGNLYIGFSMDALTTTIGGTDTTINILGSLSVAQNGLLNAGVGSTINLSGNDYAFSSNPSGFNPGTGTVNFNSTATTGTHIPALTYYNLVVNRAGNTFTADGEIAVNNNLTISAGTLDLTAQDFSVFINNDLLINGTFLAPNNDGDQFVFNIGGDITNNGTFTPNGSYLNIISDTQSTHQFLGTNGMVFNNLANTAAGSALQFQAGNTYTFNGTLTATGTSGKPVKLLSTTPASQWFIDINGSTSLLYVAVKDSGCSSSATISTATKVFNLGNNDSACWKFVKRAPDQGASEGGAGGGGGGGGGGGQGGGSGQATATANMQSQAVNTVTVNNSGSGYFVAPLVCFSGGGGDGAVATATVSGGSVTAINVSNGGSSYETTPTVVIGSPGSSGGSCGSGGGSGGSGGGGGGSP